MLVNNLKHLKQGSGQSMGPTRALNKGGAVNGGWQNPPSDASKNRPRKDSWSNFEALLITLLRCLNYTSAQQSPIAIAIENPVRYPKFHVSESYDASGL